MKWLAIALLLIFISLQYRIWFGQTSFSKIQQQEDKITLIQAENAELLQRNQKLLAEIKDLRKGTDSVEERARYQLGMIKDGEVFFRLIKKESN